MLNHLTPTHYSIRHLIVDVGPGGEVKAARLLITFKAVYWDAAANSDVARSLGEKRIDLDTDAVNKALRPFIREALQNVEVSTGLKAIGAP
jgi:hypothetical protein